YYDPRSGRWLSEDRVGFAAADANLYRAVGNQPTNLVDPSGLQGEGNQPVETAPLNRPVWRDPRDCTGASFTRPRPGMVCGAGTNAASVNWEWSWSGCIGGASTGAFVGFIVGDLATPIGGLI